MANDRSLSGLEYHDVDSESIPTDRSRRHKFRWADNAGVHVDETVPDPPDPRMDRLDRIEKATSIDELKAILKEILISGWL
jgi:hypothetical protein